VMTLNNVVAIMTLPASVVTLAATRRGKPSARLARLHLRYGGAGIFLWLLLSAASKTLSHTFKISPFLFLIFGLAAWPVVDYAANLGYLARARRYAWLGGLTAAGSALSVAAVLIAMRRAHMIALLGILQAASLWILWGLSAVVVRRLSVQGPVGGRPVALSAGVGIVESLMALTDSVMAKARLIPVSAGLYNGLATIGQALPYGAGSLALVMLTAMLDQPSGRSRWFRRTLMLFLGLAGPAELIFWLDSRAVVEFALGPQFLAVVPLLAFYSLGMLALGIMIILLTEAIARLWWPMLGLAIFGLALWVALLLRGQTVGQLAHATTLALSLLAVLEV
jgi:O-antigen/teichoic acid export membrane protein